MLKKPIMQMPPPSLNVVAPRLNSPSPAGTRSKMSAKVLTKTRPSRPSQNTTTNTSYADEMKCQAAWAASSASFGTCSSDAVYGLHTSSAATDVRGTSTPLW